MEYFDSFDDLMNAIDFIIACTPKRPHPPLSHSGMVAKKSAYKPLTAEMIRKDLLKLTHKELKERFDQARKELRIKRETEEKKIFFSKLITEADLEYWCKMPYWTIDEAIVLLLLRNPDFVNSESLKQYIPYPTRYTFIKEYCQIKKLALRAKTVSDLTDPVRPVTLILWALENNIEVLKPLQIALNKHVERVINFKRIQNQLSAPPNEPPKPTLRGQKLSRKERNKIMQEEANKIVNENPSWNKPSVIEELYEKLKANNPSLLEKTDSKIMKPDTLARIIKMPKSSR